MNTKNTPIRNLPTASAKSPERFKSAAIASALLVSISLFASSEAKGCDARPTLWLRQGTSISSLCAPSRHGSRLVFATAIFSLPSGYLLMAIFPQWHMTLLHIVFITGFSLLTLIVASRVILGHSGQEQRFDRTQKSVLAIILIMVLAMLTRVTADWMPEIRLSHYAYASISWTVAAIIWSIYLLPGVRKSSD